MKSNHNQQLESAIHRELKSLPELTAPASVANRVMTAITARDQVPWYRRSWSGWPLSVQTVSLVVMLAMFVGVCFAGWELSQMQAVARSTQEANQWVSGFNSIRHVSDILAGAAMLVVEKLGAVFIIACFLAATLAYAVFLGLGTVCFRLAFVKPSFSRYEK